MYCCSLARDNFTLVPHLYFYLLVHMAHGSSEGPSYSDDPGSEPSCAEIIILKANILLLASTFKYMS